MKPTFRNLILFIFLIGSATANAVGFQAGNEFTVVPLSGRVLVQCSGPGGPVSPLTLNCYTEILNPNEMEYFVGPAGIDADKVKLKGIRQNGSVEEKIMDYDSKAGRTSRRVNLWINTLMQTGLLEEGNNRIHFSMLKAGKVISEGDFDSLVRIGKNVNCQSDTIFDNVGNLCDNPNSACQRYFEQINYCQ